MSRILKSGNGAGALALVLVLAAVLSGALFLYWSWHSGAERSAAGPRGEELAPPFSLKDVNGNSYSSSEFAGKPTVINFFTTWCPSCRDEMPGLVELFDQHKGKGFELIGISLDTDSREELPDFIARYRIPFRILFGDQAVMEAFGGVTSVPTTIFVGRDGRIKNVLKGTIGKEELDREVRKIL